MKPLTCESWLYLSFKRFDVISLGALSIVWKVVVNLLVMKEKPFLATFPGSFLYVLRALFSQCEFYLLPPCFVDYREWCLGCSGEHSLQFTFYCHNKRLCINSCYETQYTLLFHSGVSTILLVVTKGYGVGESISDLRSKLSLKIPAGQWKSRREKGLKYWAFSFVGRNKHLWTNLEVHCLP